MMKRTLPALASATLCMAVPAAAQTVLHAALSGAQEVPGPGADGANGGATILLDTVKNQVCFTLWERGLDTPTMAHIHKGPAGTAGPVVVQLDAPASSVSSGCKPADPAVIAAIAASPEDYYVNVHTSLLPKGAMRGQLMTR